MLKSLYNMMNQATTSLAPLGRPVHTMIAALTIVQVIALVGSAEASESAVNSKYYAYYQGYIGSSTFWRQVTSMGSIPVSNGLAIWNTSGTYGAGVVSETMGYAMILAALYNDQGAFDRLSATVQAGIQNDTTGLFPWYWTPTSNNGQYVMADRNSAADADVNIALAYIYLITHLAQPF